jgi:golgin subfamily B member 1
MKSSLPKPLRSQAQALLA